MPDDDLIPAGSLLLDLTMSKLDVDTDGDVMIGYQVLVGEAMPMIFSDGFESADTSAWSSAQP